MDIYKQIVELREHHDKIQKGYIFEQIMREIHPWEYKPPIVYTAPSEQLDGVFTWKGITFIIESKAKEGIITQGSHDWEDFELKIRRRKGKGIIGVFCSLYPVHENVFDAGKRLNEEGIQTIIFDGSFWDNIVNDNLSLKDVFEFMIPYVRIKYIAKPPQIKSIKEWCFDKSKIEKQFRDKAFKTSSSFLRRYKHRFHNTIYVARELDIQIKSAVNNFKPSTLKYKSDIRHKDLPKQILVIRDVSGSGKTTSSIQIAHTVDGFISIAIAAKDNQIDSTIIEFLNSSDRDNDFSSLIEINKPIVYVVDSLDESKINIHQKRREIISLLRFMEELNKVANDKGYKLFPILFIFTIREDYWRDWENLFEDIRAQKIRKRLACFNSTELKQAIHNYSKAYNYKIINHLSVETERILSQPINLQILSESSEYEGEVTIAEVWETDILYSYFERKKDDVFKHPIMGFSTSSFMQLLSNLSILIIKKKQNLFHRIEFQELIKRIIPMQETNSDDILLILVSEQLLIKDFESGDNYRFKHSKFIEYLCSYYIANSVYLKNSVKHLDSLTNAIFDSGIVSMYQVHDNTRFICSRLFEGINEQILDYYSTSDNFLRHKLSSMRSNIAVGEKTDSEDIKLILTNTSSNSPETTWNSFFVLTAKNNLQPKNVILDIFDITWKSNKDNIDRWKTLIKIAKHDLLLNEKIIVHLLSSCNDIEWEKYLGLVLETNQRKLFKEIQRENSFTDELNSLKIIVIGIMYLNS